MIKDEFILPREFTIIYNVNMPYKTDSNLTSNLLQDASDPTN